MNRINRRRALMALPFAMGFLLFYVLPLLGSARYSLIESAFSRRFVGLANYGETILNRNFRLSVANTAILLARGVPPLVAAALLLALMTRGLGDRARVLRAALLLPMLVPSAAVTSVFSKLPLGPRDVLLCVYVWKNAGFLALVFLAALEMIPREVYEAAALDGAGPARAFFSVTLPMLGGALLFATMLALSWNLRLFREAYLLYGDYPDSSAYLMQHYMNNHFYKLNYQRLASAAILFLLALFPAVGLGVRLSNRAGGNGGGTH